MVAFPLRDRPVGLGHEPFRQPELQWPIRSRGLVQAARMLERFVRVSLRQLARDVIPGIADLIARRRVRTTRSQRSTSRQTSTGGVGPAVRQPSERKAVGRNGFWTRASPIKLESEVDEPKPDDVDGLGGRHRRPVFIGSPAISTRNRKLLNRISVKSENSSNSLRSMQPGQSAKIANQVSRQI